MSEWKIPNCPSQTPIKNFKNGIGCFKIEKVITCLLFIVSCNESIMLNGQLFVIVNYR